MLRCLLLIFAPPICTKLQCTAWPVTSQTVLHRWSRPTKHQHDWQAFHRAQLWVMTLSDFYEPSKPQISSLRSWCHSFWKFALSSLSQYDSPYIYRTSVYRVPDIFYHDSFCIVLLCVRASSIGIQYIQWPSPNVNSLKWLWISLDQILAQAPLWCRNQNTGFPCSSADQRTFGLTTWKRPEVASTYQRNQEDCQDFIPIRSY